MSQKLSSLFDFDYRQFISADYIFTLCWLQFVILPCLIFALILDFTFATLLVMYVSGLVTIAITTLPVNIALFAVDAYNRDA